MEDLTGIQKWLAHNKQAMGKYVGKWVAVSGTGVVDAAGSLSALSRKLSVQQRTELLMTRIPTKKEAASLVL